MKIILLIYMLLFIFSSYSYAWNDQVTHPTLSDYAGLKFYGPEFMNQIVQGRRARQWIQDGAILEDAGTTWQFVNGTARSLNHFHVPTITNPTKSTLETAGLSDRATGMSALLWAQNGPYQVSKGWGDWSWQKVREYYYSYLTASTQSDVDANLARTLMGLGFQMHLVQDMGHPSHVRNNTHIADGGGWILFSGFETWAAQNNSNIIRAEILDKQDGAGNFLYPVPQVAVDLTVKFDDNHNLAPVARLFDTRTYLGTNTPTTSLSQGLSEYTNGNFFSQDTIFAAERFSSNTSNKYYFPYPRKNGTDAQKFIDGQKINYISKTGEGETLTYLARSGVMSNFILNTLGEGKRFYGSFKLDEECYFDYARRLIPASVGYSKALLEYFYRGKLDVEPVGTASTFQHFFVKIKNTTATGEDMTGGDLALVIKYRLMSETGGVVTSPLSSAPYYYKVITLPGQYSVRRDQQSELVFDLGTDSLPLFATDITLQVVYQGQIGKESRLVAVGSAKLNGYMTDIALSLPTTGVYGVAAPNASGFNRIIVSAKSTSTLAQPDGMFEMVLKYRISTNDPFQNIVVETLPADRNSYYIIRANEANGVNSLQQGISKDLVFDISTTPLPIWASDVSFDVIYRSSGTTGDKPLALGRIDVSEPTPVDVYNNTDKVCIDRQWLDAGSDEAIAAVGTDMYGIALGDVFPHRISNIFFKAGPAGLSTLNVSPTDNNIIFAAAVEPGHMQRLGYILSDFQFSYTSDETVTNLDNRDEWILAYDNNVLTGYGFTNQDGMPFGSMYTIRGKKMWTETGLIYDNLEYLNGAENTGSPLCDWSTLP